MMRAADAELLQKEGISKVEINHEAVNDALTYFGEQCYINRLPIEVLIGGIATDNSGMATIQKSSWPYREPEQVRRAIVSLFEEKSFRRIKVRGAQAINRTLLHELKHLVDFNNPSIRGLADRQIAEGKYKSAMHERRARIFAEELFEQGWQAVELVR